MVTQLTRAGIAARCAAASALLLSPAALAGAVGVGVSGAVVGDDSIGVRPGVQLSYMPLPAAALELQGASDLNREWDVGLALVGRLHLPDPSQARGIFLSGRIGLGMASTSVGTGQWTHLGAGFGARPADWLQFEVHGGPDWAPGGPRWRTTAALTAVFGTGREKTHERHKAVRKPR